MTTHIHLFPKLEFLDFTSTHVRRFHVTALCFSVSLCFENFLEGRAVGEGSATVGLEEKYY
jgi:hypothetical protein